MIQIDHLKHIAAVRPPGLDRDAASWAVAEISRLRAALEEIANDPGGSPPDCVVDDMREVARKALAKEGK